MSEAVIRSHTHSHMDCIHAQQQQALPKQKKRTHTHRHGTDDERTCTLIHILVAPQQQCKPLFSAHSASGIDFASLRAYTQMSLCVRALLAYSNAVYCPIVLQPNYFLWCTFCWCCCRTGLLLLLSSSSFQFSYTFNNSNYLLEWYFKWCVFVCCAFSIAKSEPIASNRNNHKWATNEISISNVPSRRGKTNHHSHWLIHF